MLISYQPLKDTPNFFRVISCNPAQTKQDMDFLVEEIERLGEDL